jgi:hypothetical protein
MVLITTPFILYRTALHNWITLDFNSASASFSLDSFGFYFLRHSIQFSAYLLLNYGKSDMY